MRTIFSTLAVLAMAALVIVAQDKGAKGGPPGGAPKAPPKNLKIFTVDNYKQNMQSFVAALGVADKGGCNYCHDADRSVDTPKKLMAFKMVQMVMDINKNTFAGEAKVACFTCHRGQEHPVSAPPPVQ